MHTVCSAESSLSRYHTLLNLVVTVPVASLITAAASLKSGWYPSVDACDIMQH